MSGTFTTSGGGQGDFIILAEVDSRAHECLVATGASWLTLGNAVLYYWGFPSLSSGMVAVSGVLNHSGRLIVGPETMTERPQANSSGQWITLDILDDKVQVSTDQLGMLPVFYDENAVSNRLQLISMVRSTLDGELNINKAALKTFFLNTQAMTYQAGTFDSVIEGVRLLEPGAGVVVGRNVYGLIADKSVEVV